jgi:hypothetical protein
MSRVLQAPLLLLQEVALSPTRLVVYMVELLPKQALLLSLLLMPTCTCRCV